MSNEAKPATNTEAMAIGNAAREDCKTIFKFMAEKVMPLLARFEKGDQAKATVRLQFVRAYGWFATIDALGDPRHFQAYLSTTRALFEIAIDLAIMAHDPTNPPEKMYAWEESAKWKMAERTRDCYRGRPIPPHHEPRIALLNRDHDAARIRGFRERWWNGKHPMHRWTGSAGLRADAEAADSFGPHTFRDYYDCRYAELCWGTHGSALTGVRNIDVDTFPAISAFALAEAADFGEKICRFVLHYFRLFDDIAKVKFEQLDAERQHWRAMAYGTQLGLVPPPKPAK